MLRQERLQQQQEALARGGCRKGERAVARQRDDLNRSAGQVIVYAVELLAVFTSSR